MSLYIKNPEVDSMARELAAVEGVSVTQAVGIALRERLDKKARKKSPEAKLREMNRALDALWKMPIKDNRTAEEILGFNEFGYFD